MESERNDRVPNKPPADSPPAPSAEKDWASSLQVFYSSATVAASGNPQFFYSSSSSVHPLAWGAHPMVYGKTLPHNPVFGLPSPAVPALSLNGQGEAVESLEKEAKLLDGDPENGDKGASGSDTCKESGGEESSKTSRDDKKRNHEAFGEMQDEHEDKRQKRKQSNRESARRSRERRQKECEELGRQVADLNSHNANLRREIDQLHAECKRVGDENASITEELKKLYGSSALAALGVD